MVDHIVHERSNDSSSSVLIAVVVILLVLVVGWLAYNGGVFGARNNGTPDTIDVNIGGTPTGGAPSGDTGGGAGITY